MKQLKPKWYAVLRIKVHGCREADYRDPQNVIALSENLQIIYDLASDLNRDDGANYDDIMLRDVLRDFENYSGSQLYVVDMFTPTEKEIEAFEADGKIIGRPGFKLRIDN